MPGKESERASKDLEDPRRTRAAPSEAHWGAGTSTTRGDVVIVERRDLRLLVRYHYCSADFVGFIVGADLCRTLERAPRRRAADRGSSDASSASMDTSSGRATTFLIAGARLALPLHRLPRSAAAPLTFRSPYTQARRRSARSSAASLSPPRSPARSLSRPRAMTTAATLGPPPCVVSRVFSSGPRPALPLPRRPMSGVLDAIGNTPMIRVASLSEATGCDILIKCEFANPGGSVKDRVALRILREALSSGRLRPAASSPRAPRIHRREPRDGRARARMRSASRVPGRRRRGKPALMASFGAATEPVRPVSITHREHFVNVARRRAEEAAAERGPGAGYFADQFENLANYRAHLEGTGPEIWRQCAEVIGSRLDAADLGERRLDAFVCACGTGGTLAGVARYLKSKDPSVECYLVDPPGSSLYNKVTRGVLYTREEAEGKRLRNPFDTITEGVGINRLTRNFDVALGGATDEPGSTRGETLLSGAFKASDREAVEMSRYLARRDGLFLGSSSCVNIVGAVKLAKRLGPGRRVVTIACDSGVRHLSKFWSDEYVEKHGLRPMAKGLEFLEEA